MHAIRLNLIILSETLVTSPSQELRCLCTSNVKSAHEDFLNNCVDLGLENEPLRFSLSLVLLNQQFLDLRDLCPNIDKLRELGKEALSYAALLAVISIVLESLDLFTVSVACIWVHFRHVATQALLLLVLFSTYLASNLNIILLRDSFGNRTENIFFSFPSLGLSKRFSIFVIMLIADLLKYFINLEYFTAKSKFLWHAFAGLIVWDCLQNHTVRPADK